MGHRTWIKLYCDKWLTGTLRDDSPATRGTWADVLALAGNLSYGETGAIQLADGVGLLDTQIAGIFNIPLEDWLKAKQRLIETGRITSNENNIIRITKWATYQSEYQRQKPYRQNPRVQQSPLPEPTPPIKQPERLTDYERSLIVVLKELPTWPRDTSPAKLHELLADYPDLNYDLEFKKFVEWWSKRKLKAPWLALRNWLEKAQKGETYGKERTATKSKRGSRALPEKYTTPEELRRQYGGMD